VAAACLTLVLAASGTASADPGDASLLNPSEGWQYDTRWGGDALVDLNALGSYELRAAGPDGYAETRQIVAEAPSDLVLWKSVQFTPQTTLGDYTMTLWRTDVDPEEQLGQHSFQVVAPTAATIDAPADGATLFTDATTPISVTWQHLADPTGPRQISITRTQPVGGANSVCDFFGTITQGQTTDCPLPSPLTEGTYRVVAHDTPRIGSSPSRPSPSSPT
jgi:hypothetical protein